MKNLANCDPVEFLIQTNKIRKSVEKWLTATDIHNIRKRLPKYDDKMDAEKRAEVKNKQMRENLNSIIDACLEEHPVETAEVIALACFVDPGDIRNHKGTEFLGAVGEMIANEDVLSFFTSLVSLVNNGILTLVEA